MPPENAIDRLLNLGVVGVLILCGMFILLLLDKLLPYFRRDTPVSTVPATTSKRSGDLDPADWEARIARTVAATMEPVMSRQTEILRDLAEEQRHGNETLREILVYSRGRNGGQVVQSKL